jgi:hypothetical protein
MQWRFWKWFFIGLNHRPGYRQLLNRWIFLHLLIGIGLGFGAPIDAKDAASTILLPLAGIFVGLSFAWIGNTQAILKENEIEELMKRHPDGIEAYVYTYQLAILIILTTLIGWGLAGLGIFPRLSGICLVDVAGIDGFYCKMAKAILFGLASATVQECWQIVLSSQMFILSRSKIRNHKSGN